MGSKSPRDPSHGNYTVCLSLFTNNIHSLLPRFTTEGYLPQGIGPWAIGGMKEIDRIGEFGNLVRFRPIEKEHHTALESRNRQFYFQGSSYNRPLPTLTNPPDPS